jgi:hypothetical protein
MATFSQWLKLQEGRQDETGSAARYWAQVTPGRISGVTGIIRHLEKLASEDPGQDGAKALDRQYAETALAGIRSAVDEYGRDSITEQARKAGVLALVPPAGPESDAEEPERPMPRLERTLASGSPGGPYAGRSAPGTVTREQAESVARHPSEMIARSPTMEAFARIEHKQDVLQESVNALLEAVNLLVSELPTERNAPLTALAEAARRESVAAIVDRAYQNEDGSFSFLALWQAAQAGTG